MFAGNLGGGGLNIFFQGRNSHQVKIWELQISCFEEFSVGENVLGLVPASLPHTLGYACTFYAPTSPPLIFGAGEHPYVPSSRVLVQGNIRQNHPFGNPPFANPGYIVCLSVCLAFSPLFHLPLNVAVALTMFILFFSLSAPSLFLSVLSSSH